MQQLQSFWDHATRKIIYAREVARWSGKVGDEACLDWIRAGLEYDGDRRGCRSCGECCWKGVCEDHRDVTASQLRRQSWQAIILLCHAQRDGHVAPFDITKRTQAI